MSRKGFAVRSALLVGLVTITLAGPVLAQQQPNAGLGSAWPTDTQDVSRMPGYHVYTWMKSGVKYIQVNDYSGNVLVAVATAEGVFLPLPMGSDAKNLRTPEDASPDSTAGAAVYQDDSVQVTAAPQSDGAMIFLAAPTCTNPVECTSHLNGN